MAKVDKKFQKAFKSAGFHAEGPPADKAISKMAGKGNVLKGKNIEGKIKSGVNIIKNGKVHSKMSRLFGLD